MITELIVAFMLLFRPATLPTGICPFNFPAMLPLWMFPLATAAGNTFVLKPSPRTPGAAMMLAFMAKEAGLPDGKAGIQEGLAGSEDLAGRN